MYDSVNSKYTYKGTNVLKNKLKLKGIKILEEHEVTLVNEKLKKLKNLEFEKTFDEKHLKFIHEYLFSDIYEFAGVYRKENIAKENFRFSEWEYIEDNIKLVLRKVDIEKLKNLSLDDMLKEVSDIMTDLNVLHPFREGNGRLIREFIRELLECIGYDIDFVKIDYNEILNASIQAVVDDTSQIELLKRYIKKK